MTKQQIKTDCPNIEQPIKTLSFRSAAYMLLRFAGLPNGPTDVDALIRVLARRNHRHRPLKPGAGQTRAHFWIDYSR